MKKTILILLCIALLSLGAIGCTEAEPPQSNGTTAYSFTQKGVRISVDAEAAPILSALGNYLDYAESPSCAFEGMDKVYTYAGFEIETYCLAGVDYVAAVQLLDDSVATEKGIAIGSTRDAVIAAYGTPSSESEGALIYAANGMRLQFLLRDGAVTNIQYLKGNK